MKVYKIKKLIEGYRVGFPGQTVIAFPEKYLNKGDVLVGFEGKHMMIANKEKPLSYRVFADKFGRNKNYTLCYFVWLPEIKTKEQIKADEQKEHERAVSIAEQTKFL